MKRAAAYARVSTDKADQANSLESQKQFFTDYIKKQDGWKLVGVYADEGITGTSTKKRDAFNSMIHDAKIGGIDVIVTKEVSRFARNTVDTLTHTRALKEHGVEVRFINDNISTFDCDGELRLTIMASISQEESRKISSRVTWGHKRRMEQGVVFGNSEMLGFHIRNGRLLINEKEAPIVQTIFHKHTNEGKGKHTIARELDAAGIKPKKAQKWSSTMILRVLRNEKYVGDLCQRKSVTTDYLTHKRVLNTDDMVYIKNHHKPIIDRDLWDRTQAELARRRPNDEQVLRYTNRYWCSGMVWCGLCGARYTSSFSRGKQSWRCKEACGKGHKACLNAGVSDEVLKECVKYALEQLDIDKKRIIRELEDAVRKNDIPPEATKANKIKAQIAAIQAKKDRAVELVLDGCITKQDLQVRFKAYDAEIAELQRRGQAGEGGSVGVEQAIRRLTELAVSAFGEESVLGQMLERVTVLPGRMVEIRLVGVEHALLIRHKISGYKKNRKVLVGGA